MVSHESRHNIIHTREGLGFCSFCDDWHDLDDLWADTVRDEPPEREPRRGLAQRLPGTAAAGALALFLNACAHSHPAPPPAGGNGGAQTQPSQRFDNLDFNRATVKTDEQGRIVANFGIGVDVVGIFHNDKGAISYEQHPVMMKAVNPPEPLPAADRASLARSLQRYLGTNQSADPLWQRLLQDASK